MIKKVYFLTIVMLACLVLILAPLKAKATLTFELNKKYCGAVEPGNDPPWLSATFEDLETGEVLLTLDSFGLENQEYVASWYFNIEPDDDLISSSSILGKLTTDVLDINYKYDGSDTKKENIYVNTSIKIGDNALSAAKNKIFDILFDFPQYAAPKNSSDYRFTAGIELEYIITGKDYLSSLSAQSFNFYCEDSCNAPYDPALYSAAHILKIDDPNCGWIAYPAPEPCTMILLGSGLIGIAGLRRKFKN